MSKIQATEWPFKAGEWSLAEEGSVYKRHVNVLIEDEGGCEALTLVRNSWVEEDYQEVDHFLRIDKYDDDLAAMVMITSTDEVDRIIAALERVRADLQESVRLI